MAYRAARLRLKVRLQVQGRVEIAAGVSAAAALDGVHAHRDAAIVVSGQRRRGMREAALSLRALAHAAQELSAHLRQHRYRLTLPTTFSIATERRYCRNLTIFCVRVRRSRYF